MISSLGAFADEGKWFLARISVSRSRKVDFLIADQMLDRRGASRRPSARWLLPEGEAAELCCSIGGVDLFAVYLGSIHRFQLGFFEYLSEETRDAIDDQKKAQEE